MVVMLTLGALPPAAHADDGALPSMAVQNRRHGGTHEFTAAVGTLPLDAFTKGLTVSAAYSLHFDELFAWEVAQFFYSFPVETDLKGELGVYDLRPTPFERVEYYVTTNFVFKPLYWKGAWLNSALSYGELLLLLGGGYGWMTQSSRPVVDVGVATRIYASDWASLRLDVRGLTFVNEESAHHELWIGLGVSL